MNGFIYIRCHNSHDIYDACKLGQTQNIPDRDSQYATNEIERGQFTSVYEVPKSRLELIERMLKYEFSYLNVRYDGGTEYFKKKIINLIEPYFNTINLKYRKLSDQEIYMLLRPNRVRNTFKKIKINDWINALRKSSKNSNYKPRDYQIDIIDKSIDYFSKNDKGILALICGIGKTLISLWIAQRLNSNTILIGVPNVKLINQWKDAINNIFGKEYPRLIVSENITIETISEYLKNNSKKCIIITTYKSSFKIHQANQNLRLIFNLKINDECHHLTTKYMEKNKITKKYIEILNIKSNKQLSLTATLKELSDDDNTDNVIGNNNIDYFGEIIERRTLLWAINNNIVCDYIIQTIVSDGNIMDQFSVNFNITNDCDKRLFLSAYATLKSINDGYSHHILIYSNSKENSIKIIEYIKLLLKKNYFDIPVYYSEYHGDMNSKNQENILSEFYKSQFGIITCVYCLGEGWDFPRLDAVVFAEKMESDIRIVQSALRASRKDKNDVSKISKIIVPIMNDEWRKDTKHSDYQKVIQIIYKISLEDENVIQKLKVIKMNEKKSKLGQKKIVFEEDINLTNELKLSLKNISRSEMRTYKEAKKRIIAKNIKNKTEYYDNIEYLLPLDPENVFKNDFVDWIDYLSLGRSYYNLETCKARVKIYIQSNNIKINKINQMSIIEKICDTSKLFPPPDLWMDYYKINDINELFDIKPIKKTINILAGK